MTTIVVVTKDDKAVIAADSQTSNGRIRAPTDMREYPKRIHKAGDAYVGLAGTSAHQNVFHSLIKHYEEKLDFSSADAIFETLRGAQTILEDEYYVLTKENDRNQEYASNQLSGLVASSSGIFEFHSYREVAQYNSFWAIGSGDEIALGALEVLYVRGQLFHLYFLSNSFHFRDTNSDVYLCSDIVDHVTHTSRMTNVEIFCNLG